MLGIGRFASADTLVPNPANPQSFNRYSYVYNNPLKLLDPSGHAAVCGMSRFGCEHQQAQPYYGTPQEAQNALDFTGNTLRSFGEGIVSVFCEPCDWGVALSDGFQWHDSIGMLPLIPATVGRWADEFYHGTRHARNAFADGIDAARGAGQLGPGFYVTLDRSTAEWYARVWSKGSDTPKLLKLTAAEKALNDLEVIKLGTSSREYKALTDAWQKGEPVPSNLQYLIDDYDAIITPFQIKFNPRAQDFLDSLSIEFEDLAATLQR